MSQQEVSSNGMDQQAKAKRAQGVFPRLSLSKALELPQTIYSLGEGEPVRRLRVFHELNRAPDSGPSRTLIAVSNSGYGLTTGSAQAEYLDLTDRGRKIVNASNEIEKYQAIYDALFSNEIFVGFMTRFNQRSMPNDDIAIDYFKRTHGLSDTDAKAFLSVIRENVNDFGFIQELSGRQVLVSREMALESLQNTLPAAMSHSDNGSANDVSTVSVQQTGGSTSAAPKDVLSFQGVAGPQIHFNIQIHLPENAAPDVYETIFRSIATNLLGRSKE